MHQSLLQRQAFSVLAIFQTALGYETLGSDLLSQILILKIIAFILVCSFTDLRLGESREGFAKSLNM